MEIKFKEKFKNILLQICVKDFFQKYCYKYILYSNQNIRMYLLENNLGNFFKKLMKNLSKCFILENM